MTRRMSCSMTIDAVRARTKRVTRRHVDTWKDLKPGDRLTLIEKGMGLPKGANQVVLAEVEIVSVRVESITDVWVNGGDDELKLEGIDLLEMSPNRFAYWWAENHGYGRLRNPQELWAIQCRRIEWRYLTLDGASG